MASVPIHEGCLVIRTNEDMYNWEEIRVRIHDRIT